MMIGDDYSSVIKGLDKIRKKKPKFVCLNDNMNHSVPNTLV